MMRTATLLCTLLLVACSTGGAATDVIQPSDGDTEVNPTEDAAADTEAPRFYEVETLVLLDGEPVEGAVVSQGGREERWVTGPDGKVVVEIDTTVIGDLAIVASHPEARIEAAMLWPGLMSVTIELDRFDPSDNPDYLFQDPGMPGHSPTSAYCGHCHVTIAKDFYASRHPFAASNPALQDLYSGTSAAREDEAACVAAGGQWRTGIVPGTGEAGGRCYIGQGVLPALNPDCGEEEPCDGKATQFGGCADCHAPGIDGKLGGRDLLEAKGLAFQRGIHCDVCHHVESVDDQGAPGIAGRLRIVRPSDPAETPSFGEFRPLLFGPHDDIPNPFMGIVQRLFYRESRFCAGCHELERKAIVPGHAVDSARWPSGTLPLLSTFSEWQDSGMGISCQGCHMPPDPDVANTADLQLFPTTVGLAGGWYRPAPSVRRHLWQGPHSPESTIRDMAAAVELTADVADGSLTVTAKATNVGAAHGLPTGEPLRSVLLLVEARCSDTPLKATGGDAVPDFGGYLDRKSAAEDWTLWPGAAVGDVVRVVSRPGTFYDYTGFGPFGDGTFDAAAKGMPVEVVVGQVAITAVEDGVVTFDGPLPEGDVAYRTAAGAIPAPGDEPLGFAGAPGFGFARVLVDGQGHRMVPHFLAVDVASDNRLVAGGSWTSTHQFEATCAEPTVRAALLYRRYPLALARERGWEMKESILVETTK